LGELGVGFNKAETDSGWLFPVGDEAVELGNVNMFNEMLRCYETNAEPTETFYDGYIVNEIIDACLRSAVSKKWEPVKLEIWRGRENVQAVKGMTDFDDQYYLIKDEKLPNGDIKIILKDKITGEIVQREKTGQ